MINWKTIIIPAAIVGCIIGSWISPEKRDNVMGDFVAQKLKEYYSKPYGVIDTSSDLMTVAEGITYIFGITLKDEKKLEFLR